MKLAALVLLALASTARADTRVAVYDGPPGAQEQDEPPSVDVPPPPPPSALDLARERAVESRGLVVGSALTVPEGHVEVTGRALLPVGVLGQISAGLTSSTEIWASYGGLIAFDEESESTKLYGFGMKQAIANDRTRQLAITGSLWRVDGEPLFSGSLVGSICSNDDCDTLINLSVGLGASNETTVPMINGGILTGSGAYHAAVELMWLGKGALGILGGRIGGENLALDLGVGLPLGGGEKVIPLPMAGLGLRM